MSDTIIQEWHFLWYTVATGAVFALVYDMLRLIRLLFHHSRLLVDVEDLLYWTVCFIVSFALLYYVNHGVIRFFAVLGAAAGMYLYSLTLGRFLVRGIYRLIRIICSPFVRFACFAKIMLTRVTNHFTICLRGCIVPAIDSIRIKRGERKHAGKSCKGQGKNKTRISPKEK